MKTENNGQQTDHKIANEKLLTTSGDTVKKEEIQGDKIDRTLVEVSSEEGSAYSGEDNPDNISDVDDLHEIQASDDIDEPGPEGKFPETGSTGGVSKEGNN
jgi:hypothetical protein